MRRRRRHGIGPVRHPAGVPSSYGTGNSQKHCDPDAANAPETVLLFLVNGRCSLGAVLTAFRKERRRRLRGRNFAKESLGIGVFICVSATADHFVTSLWIRSTLRSARGTVVVTTSPITASPTIAAIYTTAATTAATIATTTIIIVITVMMAVKSQTVECQQRVAFCHRYQSEAPLKETRNDCSAMAAQQRNKAKAQKEAPVIGQRQEADYAANSAVSDTQKKNTRSYSLVSSLSSLMLKN